MSDTKCEHALIFPQEGSLELNDYGAIPVRVDFCVLPKGHDGAHFIAGSAIWDNEEVF